MTNTEATERLTAVLGAVDNAIENATGDAPLTISLPSKGNGRYTIESPNLRLVVIVNFDDDLLNVFHTTRPGVMVGPDVSVVWPTPEVAAAVVAAMLVQVVTA